MEYVFILSMNIYLCNSVFVFMEYELVVFDSLWIVFVDEIEYTES